MLRIDLCLLSLINFSDERYLSKTLSHHKIMFGLGPLGSVEEDSSSHRQLNLATLIQLQVLVDCSCILKTRHAYLGNSKLIKIHSYK